VAGIFIVEQTILGVGPHTVIAANVIAFGAGRVRYVDTMLVELTALATSPTNGQEQTGHVGLLELAWLRVMAAWISRCGGLDGGWDDGQRVSRRGRRSGRW
jgi:hypothetical protein